jgi:hypothetical protein
MLKFFHALNTKVGQNIVMTALNKIQHVCMRVMRVAESSVCLSLLPRQLGNLSNSILQAYKLGSSLQN